MGWVRDKRGSLGSGSKRSHPSDGQEVGSTGPRYLSVSGAEGQELRLKQAAQWHLAAVHLPLSGSKKGVVVAVSQQPPSSSHLAEIPPELKVMVSGAEKSSFG